MKADLAEPITLYLINYNGLAHLQETITVLYSLQTRFDATDRGWHSQAKSSNILLRSGVKIFELIMHGYWRLVK